MGLLFHTDAWQPGHHAQFVLLYVYYLLTVPDSTEEGRLQMAVILGFTIVSTFMSIHAYVVLQSGLSQEPSPHLPFAIVPVSCSFLPSCDLLFLPEWLSSLFSFFALEPSPCPWHRFQQPEVVETSVPLKASCGYSQWYLDRQSLLLQQRGMGLSGRTEMWTSRSGTGVFEIH